MPEPGASERVGQQPGQQRSQQEHQRTGQPGRRGQQPRLHRAAAVTVLLAGLLHSGLQLPATASAQEQRDEGVSADRVLGFDPSTLDANGLVGPADGKRALSYEFCIPADPTSAAEVRAIDPSARVYEASPGHIGCSREQVLVIGHTHQPGFAAILQRLADLPYVHRIDESHFE
jgi:hypothetical protein